MRKDRERSFVLRDITWSKISYFGLFCCYMANCMVEYHDITWPCILAPKKGHFCKYKKQDDPRVWIQIFLSSV